MDISSEAGKRFATTTSCSHRWRAAVPSPDSTARFLAFSMVLERCSLRALAADASFSAAVGSFGLPERGGGNTGKVRGGFFRTGRELLLCCAVQLTVSFHRKTPPLYLVGYLRTVCYARDTGQGEASRCMLLLSATPLALGPPTLSEVDGERIWVWLASPTICT